jgi:hypothetical protein
MKSQFAKNSVLHLLCDQGCFLFGTRVGRAALLAVSPGMSYIWTLPWSLGCISQTN